MQKLVPIFLLFAALLTSQLGWAQRTESVGNKVFQQCDQHHLLTQIKDLKFALGEPFVRDAYLNRQAASQRSYDAMQCAELESEVRALVARVVEGEEGYTDVDFAPVEAGSEPVVAFRECGDAMHHQGINYNTVAAAGRCWMSEPLRTVQYADGTPLPEIRSNTAWARSETAGWSVYDSLHHHADMAGLLYNGFAALAEEHGGVCPLNWHVAQEAEWSALAAAFGNRMPALKSADWDGTNASGLSLLPGGFREAETGAFASWGSTAVYWTAESEGILYSVASGTLPATHSAHPLNTGASIICVKNK